MQTVSLTSSIGRRRARLERSRGLGASIQAALRRSRWPPAVKSVMRVLIVDDSRLARIMLRKALPPSLSTEVIEAANGTEAIRCVQSSRVDLMLLDLTMPDRDGYQVLKTL